MKRMYYWFFFPFLSLVLIMCKNDEVEVPPIPSFTVDKTSGILGVDVFIFKIPKVDGVSSVSIYPYGDGHPEKTGILIEDNLYVDGVANVEVVYDWAGTFEAYAVSNNHNAAGTSIENSVSGSTIITITSPEASMLSFSLTVNKGIEGEEVTIEGDIDEGDDGNTISVVLPYAYGKTITKVDKLVATYDSIPFSVVEVDGNLILSGKELDFSSPITYKVTSQDGKVSKEYKVSVSVELIEEDYAIKSASIVNKRKKNDANRESFRVFIENDIDENAGKKYVVIHDVKEISNTDLDSVSFEFEMEGKYSIVKFNDKKILSSDMINLSSGNNKFVSYAQDSTNIMKDYSVYLRKVPKLMVTLSELNPPVIGDNVDFSIALKVLSQTPLSELVTTLDFEKEEGVEVTVNVDGSPFVSGNPIDYSERKVAVQLLVKDGELTYHVDYEVNISKLN